MAHPDVSGRAGHRVAFEPSPKRVRVVVAGSTIVDTRDAGLVFETGQRPVYYFPRRDVRMDLLEPTAHQTQCPFKGDASYFTIAVDGDRRDNAVWSYEKPLPQIAAIAGRLAFYWSRVDHWLEEDEEVFGHARDPYSRVDVRPSAREVTVTCNGELVARTRRALFLFETGLPTRYYIPPEDVRTELLTKTDRRTVCPYKGWASYWSVTAGGQTVEDAVWAYLDPLPDCPRIAGHFAFYPDRVDRIDVEGEPQL